MSEAMKSIYFIVCFLILGNVSRIYGNIVCSPGDDLLPNPLCCTSFYQCANGVPILFQCAANHEGEPPLVFDPNLKQCVFYNEYPCGISVDPTTTQTSLPSTPTQNPTTTQPPLPTSPTPTSTTTQEPLPTIPTPTPGIICSPGDDLLPNPLDCNSFYQCANGVPILFQCAANHEGEPPLVFDPNLKRCVFYNEYPCGISVDPTTTQTSLPSTPTQNPTTTQTPFPPITTPTPTTTQTPLPPTPTPTPGIICSPGDDLLPNPLDCNSFYQCANGVPILFQCAANHEGEPPLNFDPISKVCVFPHEYPCQCHKQDRPDSCLETKLNSTTNCAYCFDCFFGKYGSPVCDSYENLVSAECQYFSYDDVPNLEPGSDPCEIVCYPGRPRNISVTFTIDKHPLDLYYLMDVSGSMHDDRDNLVLLSSDLIDTLKSLTPDFHIGYGSFIDKPRAPFGNAARNDYSFRNNLPLTDQTDNFMKNVRDTVVPLPDAYDVPESHGDALAQVIECESNIGWRQHTRRVVLLATDATFHVAGEGALGNIYAPYVDGCYLDANGYYTQQLTMDYPSVQQLATAYSKHQYTTTVIFATNTSTLNFYEQVASQFKSAYIAVLNTDSSNILDIVRSEFAKIQSRMEIENSKTDGTVKFRYFSNCASEGSNIETMFCENLPPSGEVTFTVQIDLDKCPDDPNEIGADFILNPVGLPTFVSMKLVYLC